MNQALFLILNAPAHPSPAVLWLATALAEKLIWFIPILIGAGWLYGGRDARKAVIVAVVAGVAGLLAAWLIGEIWPHPRPFMVGIGHTFMHHAPDASFPSDHLTFWWSITLSLALHRGWHRTGSVLVLLGLAIAWARIYLGVHWPFDMLGAALVAASCAGLASYMAGWYLPPVYRRTLHLHAKLLGPLIRRGWVRE